MVKIYSLLFGIIASVSISSFYSFMHILLEIFIIILKISL